MDLTTAAKKFRKWQVGGMVARAGDSFCHRTKLIRSQKLFIRVVTILGGDVIGETESNGLITTIVSLPDEVIPIIEPRSGRGRPAGTKGGGRPKLPEGKHRVQQSARFHPDTRPLADAIANELSLDNWSWAVDVAVRRLAKELNLTS